MNQICQLSMHLIVLDYLHPNQQGINHPLHIKKVSVQYTYTLCHKFVYVQCICNVYIATYICIKE